MLGLLDEAVRDGARLDQACDVVGLDARTVQRWRLAPGGDDQRRGPRHHPGNRLSEAQRARILAVANSPEFRDLSPKQIVPKLADDGTYLGSESTFYRLLRANDLLTHRQHSRPRAHRPRALVATGACQVWSWDITYLPTTIRGQYFYLYLVEDIWSRKIVGWHVHPEECNEQAAGLIDRTCVELGVDPSGLVLHSDNGGPMKGSTMLLTLQRLGIVPSFSRPRVSDDNPFSEALFRTLKYRPAYPRKPFPSLEAAQAWVASFVRWYNTEHLHSALSFVTPDDRHHGRDVAILAARARTYERARRRHPERWTRSTRNWKPVGEVHLNPERVVSADEAS